MHLLGSGIVAIVAAFAASMLGGALGGVAVGGKAIGNELAALMGAFYGPLAGWRGVLIGVIIIAIAH